MRRIGLLALCCSFIPLVAACGDDDDGDDDVPAIDGGLPTTDAGGDAGGITSGFMLKTPDITVAPGDERTYCYYTTLKLERDVGVKRWSSHMTNGSHHVIVYFTNGAQKPDGTIDEECGGMGGSGANAPIWTYAAQTVDADMNMPAGVGMTVPKEQHLYVQMHYLNATEQDLKVHVEVTAETYEAGVEYVPAAAFVTYHSQINLQDGDENKTFGGTCDVPAGVKFFTLSTHTHKQSTHTQVEDAVAPSAKMVFQSDDWEHPGATDWLENNYTFESNKLKYSCTYTNHTGRTITDGQSARTDEMCMAVGYFFPASAPKFCVNSVIVQ